MSSNSNIKVYCRVRPLSPRERRKQNGDGVCIPCVDSKTIVFKHNEKDIEEETFSFDKIFPADAAQADVYEFLALPIVRDAVNAVNGTIITYGQTRAGKTYSMVGPSVLESEDQKKGLLPRVIDGLFQHLRSAEESTKYTIKLAMVEIYMEKVRDLLDLSKNNLQIKETKLHGIVLAGVTEIRVTSAAAALHFISTGVLNRAVGKNQMNMASSRSHCVYILKVQQECTKDKRVKTGKLMLVDLAGSERVEKTGADGKILEESKFINKSLSALGNVIYALTCAHAKATHVPYRDTKLTRILQDALGGNCSTALLCCCPSSHSTASGTLSTLRFGTRAKVSRTEDKIAKSVEVTESNKDGTSHCYSAGHVLLTDNCKCRPRGLLICEEPSTIQGSAFSPIPASMHWHLSPFHEEGDSPASPSSDWCDLCSSRAKRRASTPPAVASFNYLVESPSEEDRTRSPVSVGSLNSGNVIQTSLTDSGSERSIDMSWLSGSGNIQNLNVDAELDALVGHLQSTTVSHNSLVQLLDQASSSFQFNCVTAPSWRMFEMEELDCCRCLSEDEEDVST